MPWCLWLGMLGHLTEPMASAGWDDLPGEVHREILRLVPLCDATAARAVSREMRDEVDEVWRAWGIRATAEAYSTHFEGSEEVTHDWSYSIQMSCGPLAVYAYGGSHAHHLASLGQWWLAVLAAEGQDINGIFWKDSHLPGVSMVMFSHSPLVLAVRAMQPVGRQADGEVEWEYALGEGEVAQMVRAAVAMGSDVSRRARNEWPLMSYCAGRGCLEAVKACLAAGAEVEVSGNPTCTALMHAARGGHEKAVEVLLEAGASASREGLLVGVCGGRPTPRILRRLVEAGADVNARIGFDEYTALQRAAAAGNVAVMEALVDLGADLTAEDRSGEIPMHYAGDGEAVRWLAARGLSIHGGGGDAPSPLHKACEDGRVDTAHALIELGADVNAGSKEGTPLHEAAACTKKQAVEVVRLLLAAGADVRAVTEPGKVTPLHRAWHPSVVDLLVDAGADLEAQDALGRTPIFCAAASMVGPKDTALLRLADRGARLSISPPRDQEHSAEW